MQRRQRFIGAAVFAVASCLLIAAAGEDAIRVKSPQSEQAFSVGNYPEAYRLIEVDIKACTTTERQPDRCMDLLLRASTYALAAGDNIASEQIARRAIKLAQSFPGKAQGDEVFATVQLAGALMAQGKIAEAEMLNRKALADAQSTFGPQHVMVGTIENALALVLDVQGRSVEAEPFHRRAIATAIKSQGQTSPMIPTLYNGLGNNLVEQARYREADKIYTSALVSARAIHGEKHPIVAQALGSLAGLKQTIGDFAAAEAMLKEAAEIDRAALGEMHPLVGRDRSAIGALYLALGRLPEAEAEFRAALAISENSEGPNHPAVASDLGNLAATLRTAGRAKEAEALGRRALDIDIRAFGEDNPRVAAHLGNLASNLEEQQRTAEAEPLRERALAIQRKNYGESHPAIADGLANLAGNFSLQKRYDAGEPMLRKALAIQEDVFGKNSLQVAGTLTVLGVLEAKAELIDEASTFFQRALDIRRARLGEQNLDSATSHHNMAAILDMAGKNASAESHARKALAIRQALLGETHPLIAASETLLAKILLKRKETRKEALDLAGSAINIVRMRRHQIGIEGDVNTLQAAELRARSMTDTNGPVDRAFSVWLEAAASQASDDPAAAAQLGAQGFQIAQEMRISSSAQAMAQTAARTAASDGPLSELVRHQQDLSARIRLLDEESVAALGAGLTEKSNAFRSRVESNAAELDIVDKKLLQSYPDYARLITPSAISLKEAQSRLADDEGMLLIVPADEDIYIFSASRASASWYRLAGGVKFVADNVAALRCQLDGSTCQAAGEESLFDMAIAHGLYEALIAPVEPALAGMKKLFVTASGPIANLPLDLLATDGEASWLGDRYAMISLPSVSILRGGKISSARTVPDEIAFMGYGDPLFSGSAPTGAGLDLAGQPNSVNRETLLSLDPLPGTRRELYAMARVLGVSRRNVVTGMAATEAAVRSDKRLRTANVIAFATHGSLPGDLNGHNEPALAFSAPTNGDPNDGWLTASEAAELQLHARWVILSACNTGSSQGDSDSLSALARAFLYAGADALLASHWRVADDATAALTVETLRIFAAEPELGRAIARQKAIQAVRSGHRSDGRAIRGWRSAWKNPAMWAPFTLVAATSD